MRGLIFPGQGSQQGGMGEVLFAAEAERLRRADEILGFSVREVCLGDSQHLLNLTRYTQPALFVVNAFSYAKWQQENPGQIPDFTLGHSLGELNALHAAGVFDFETGLVLVKKRAELMAEAQGGGMAAVAGLGEDDVAKILARENFTTLEIANVNAVKQIVISGERAELGHAEAVFYAAQAQLYKILPVSAAFHSRHMRAAGGEFFEHLKNFEFRAPRFPVIANLTALPYDMARFGETLAGQICGKVLWQQSIASLIAKGATEFEECGPGNVLTGLVRRIKREL